MFLKIPSYPILFTCLDCAVLFKKDLIDLSLKKTLAFAPKHWKELWEICREKSY